MRRARKEFEQHGTLQLTREQVQAVLRNGGLAEAPAAPIRQPAMYPAKPTSHPSNSTNLTPNANRLLINQSEILSTDDEDDASRLVAEFESELDDDSHSFDDTYEYLAPNIIDASIATLSVAPSSIRSSRSSFQMTGTDSLRHVHGEVADIQWLDESDED